MEAVSTHRDERLAAVVPDILTALHEVLEREGDQLACTFDVALAPQ